MSAALAIALAIFGVMVLIVLHEAGHAVAAKATGMRVEQLALFFGPKVFRARRGETEYAIGTIPLGGYAKISGMNPEEDLPPEVVPRAYCNQPVWKRIVVVLAGPVVNLVLAFCVLFAVSLSGERATELEVNSIVEGSPAASHLQGGDAVLAVDGFRGRDLELTQRARRFQLLTDRHRCSPPPVDGCRARVPVALIVERDGLRRHITLRPYYDAELDRNRMGLSFRTGRLVAVDRSAAEAAEESLDAMWRITSATVSIFARLFKSQEREKLGSVVGAVEVTRQAFQLDAELALTFIGLISLSLALINLLPFLPLDGGHVFWALVEKARGRRVPFAVMERASVLGFLLFMMVFFIGLSNDIDRFGDGTFDLR